jgi:hypothetical protein
MGNVSKGKDMKTTNVMFFLTILSVLFLIVFLANLTYAVFLGVGFITAMFASAVLSIIFACTGGLIMSIILTVVLTRLFKVEDPNEK